MATNANFTNPFGLIYRMLKSGNPAARGALVREAARIVAKPADYIMSTIESRTVQQAAGRESLPLILIVGPPRGGTTMVYQVLANALDVSFPNNLSALFSRSPITATRWLQKLFTAKPGAITNYFGQTVRLDSPNDAFSIWNRWLGSNRYELSQVLDEAMIQNMQSFFTAWTTVFKKPWLNKNNRNTNCLTLLADSLPASYFVVVNRAPVEIARSLIRARQAVQGSKSAKWGLHSHERHKEEDFGYVQDVCEQIIEINQSIDLQLSTISPERVVKIDYHTFCDEPQRYVDELIAAIPGLRRSLNQLAYDPDLVPSSAEKLSDDEELLIRKFLHCEPATVPNSP